MNMKKLLATTAIAALAATAVNAAELTYQGNNTAAGVAIANGVALAGVTGLPDITGSLVQPIIATEVNMASGIFDFVLDLTDPLPTVTNSILRIQLPTGMEFSTSITSGAFNSGETADTDTAAPTSVFNISGGGGAGQNFVNVIISGAGPDEDLFFMDLPIKMNDSECTAPGRLAVGISTDSGVPIENGGDGTTAPILQNDSTGGGAVAETLISCVMSLSRTVAVDDGTTGDEMANPLFQTFTGTDGLSAPSNANKHALSGTILAAFGAAPSSFPPNAAVPLDATDISTVTFSVTLGDVVGNAAGVDELGIDFDNGNGASIDLFGVKNGNAFDFTVAGSNIGLLFNGTADDLIIGLNTVSGPTTVQAQSVSVGNVVFTFDLAAGTAFGDSTVLDANKTIAGPSALDPLVLEADMFGPFDWVSGTGALHVFRMTGMPNTSASGLVSFANCAAGTNGQQPFTFSAPNGTASNFEGLILSTDLEPLNMGFKRCDITFFVFDNLANADMDRLIIAPPGSVASAYNDGANNATSDAAIGD